MKLDHIIEAYVADQEWREVSVERDEAKETCEASLHLSVSNQSYRTFIEADEKREMFFLYMYAPFSVIEGKFVDACMLFNFLNDQYTYRGKLTVLDDGAIRYKECIDLDRLEPNMAMIDNMVSSGVGLFRDHCEAIAAVALTRKTYEAIREDYDKKNAAREALKQQNDTEENGNAGPEEND
ncbi:MAG: YbjN domain-containing protein [Chlorobiaceae bacterium]